MTYEEAVLILTRDRALCLFNPWTGENVPIDEDCRMSAEALELAIAALEQQIPKKPNDKFNVPDYVLTYGICPSCNRGVNSDMKFCSECGQAIEWR